MHTFKKIIFTVLSILASVDVYSQAMHVDGTLGVIGDKIILRSDLETEMAQMIRSGDAVDTQLVRCMILEQLIVKKLMLNQAEIDSLPLSDERIEAEIENRLRYFQRQAGGQAELERYLGKTLSEYKEEIRPKMREQLLAQEMESKITGGIKVSPQEVKEFFESLPSDSLPIIPTEVEVAQLIIEAPVSPDAKDFARTQLESIRLRILKGENFDRLARLYSEDPGSKENGGLLPEFGRGEMVPEFERMAFKLKPDSMSEVFESPYGFHIMKLIGRKGERVSARHILIRPQNTTSDFIIASSLADSLYDVLQNKNGDWCNIVKKYTSESLGDRGNCGFLADENTGSQKTIFDALPTEIKLAVEKMSPGSYARPAITRTPDGKTVYRIIYLKSFTPPHEANLIQDYSRIQLEAEANKKQKAVDSWVTKTRAKTYIRISKTFNQCPELAEWESK